MVRRLGNWYRNGLSFIGVLVLAGTVALAQQPPAAPPDQTPAQTLAPQQLDNLVAPIALYPDPLLGQVLVASTYPVELVEAQQWLQANSNLRGQQLTDAARQQNWDASVQAMVAMPDVLSKLTQDIRWTTDLGNAFLAQQADVMAAVQRMRARAQANGKLSSTAQETVTTENQGGQQAIAIQPADPQVIYVPTYDPAYIWGPPAWGYYPPLVYPGYGFWWGPGIDIGFCFGGWGGWGFGGWGWGWGPNWFGHSIFVNNFFFNRYGYHSGFGFRGGFGGRTAWVHDPGHRLGVGYPNARLSSRFGAASQASRIAAGRSGNWHSFGEGNIGARSGFRGGSSQMGGRSFQSPQGSSGWQHFQGQGRQSYQGSGQRYSAPAQRYSAPAQRYSAPAQRYSAPAQRYSAPAQRYSAPAQHFQSAPRMSSPSFRGGSSGGSFHSSGGGGFHGGGGGGGFHGGGGGGHGGRR